MRAVKSYSLSRSHEAWDLGSRRALKDLDPKEGPKPAGTPRSDDELQLQRGDRIRDLDPDEAAVDERAGPPVLASDDGLRGGN